MYPPAGSLDAVEQLPRAKKLESKVAELPTRFTECVYQLQMPIRMLIGSTREAQRHGNVTRPTPGTGYATYCKTPYADSNVRFRIKLHFKDSRGNLLKTIEANEGDDILSLAHEHDIDLEGTP